MSAHKARIAELEGCLQEARRDAAEANARMTQMQESRARLSAQLSHKLRTQLGIVQGYAEMLEAAIYGAINSGQREAVDAIKESSARMLMLVNDMLDLARLDAGQLSLSCAPFSLAQLVQEVERVMAPRAADKGLLLAIAADEDLPDFVIGDQKRIEQIVANLVGQAIDVTEAGCVHLRVYRSSAELWAFEVSDTGPGFPSECPVRVSEPLQSAAETVVSGRSDNGVSLHIAERLVDLMDGSLQVPSGIEEGRSFIVTLPLATLSLSLEGARP